MPTITEPIIATVTAKFPCPECGTVDTEIITNAQSDLFKNGLDVRCWFCETKFKIKALQ